MDYLKDLVRLTREAGIFVRLSTAEPMMAEVRDPAWVSVDGVQV
ncbi:MAG TPA: hypothetical protein VIG28_00785 [Leifsonia sp.]